MRRARTCASERARRTRTQPERRRQGLVTRPQTVCTAREVQYDMLSRAAARPVGFSRKTRAGHRPRAAASSGGRALRLNVLDTFVLIPVGNGDSSHLVSVLQKYPNQLIPARAADRCCLVRYLERGHIDMWGSSECCVLACKNFL